MNKEQAQKLIERLSGNNKDMFLGDVLELITTLPRRPTADPTAKKYILYKEQINLTVLYWSALGLNKPLQTILDEAECEGALSIIKVHNGCYELYRDTTKISEHSTLSGANSMADKFPPSLKSPALKLFSYLNVLFPDK